MKLREALHPVARHDQGWSELVHRVEAPLRDEVTIPVGCRFDGTCEAAGRTRYLASAARPRRSDRLATSLLAGRSGSPIARPLFDPLCSLPADEEASAHARKGSNTCRRQCSLHR
ncbi:MAG: hypothetical protein IRZ31_13700 [Thermogemmatispora sp.]|uniref:hypothetical protein n=1 Tax=Thermogemmatispora sp. TaxID=1968838 RepID=UPI00262297FC|nr:hypothetical protein [Thermogemmatispora sp.]MBX5457946.1 hypothetical protein [Thermogemmatispora sp.]